MSESSGAIELAAGDRVKLIALPPYVKTAEPLPMLRPPSVLAIGAEGTVLGVRPGNNWAVRFENGAYLLAAQYLERV
jgi:hypothetical protein